MGKNFVPPSDGFLAVAKLELRGLLVRASDLAEKVRVLHQDCRALEVRMDGEDSPEDISHWAGLADEGLELLEFYLAEFLVMQRGWTVVPPKSWNADTTPWPYATEEGGTDG